MVPSIESDTKGKGDVFPIRTVSTLTGVNAITLRAWERRYGLVKPVRTPSGHRVYTRADIDNIHGILAMLENGVAIGRVKDALPARATTGKRSTDERPWQGYRDRMMAAIAQFDENALEALYNELLSLHPLDQVTGEVLMQVFRVLGDHWQTGVGGIAEEHFFSVFLRNKLGARFHHRGARTTGAKLVLACLPGEFHEIGVLLFGIAAHEAGFRLVMLGANMPLVAVGYAARHSQADAIVLSGSAEPQSTLFEQELPRLVRTAGMPVFLGGPVSVPHRDGIVAAGAQPLGSDVNAALRRIKKTMDDAGR
jgi:MerR family transcriptional regulator, light-induced transcriptional regulator